VEVVIVILLVELDTLPVSGDTFTVPVTPTDGPAVVDTGGTGVTGAAWPAVVHSTDVGRCVIIIVVTAMSSAAMSGNGGVPL